MTIKTLPAADIGVDTDWRGRYLAADDLRLTRKADRRALGRLLEEAITREDFGAIKWLAEALSL